MRRAYRRKILICVFSAITMSGLKDKVVLVTGASSGIGKGTAIHMAGLGCRLSIVARNTEALAEVAELCKKAGSPDVLVAPHDLSIEDECVKAVEETVAHFGGEFFM